MELLNRVGTCGVIMNAWLLWVDIHRKMAPENVWKIHALNKFLPDEITVAKVILWRIAGDGIIGIMTKRQGVNKSSSEIIDICLALKALSEKDSLPLFICTSGMVAQTPLYSISAPKNEISEMSMRLKTMEDSINCILLQRHTDVQCEIDSSGLSTRLKTIEETMNSLLARSLITDASVPLQRFNDTTENKTVPIATNIEGQTAMLAQSPNIEWLKLPTVLPSSIQPIRPSEAATKENDWNIVENKKARTTWRQKANILTGTAKGDAGGDILSADVNLVVYGLAKNVTSLQLSRFMESKGLNILNCDLLTKFDGARSNSFKITIRSCEYDK